MTNPKYTVTISHSFIDRLAEAGRVLTSLAEELRTQDWSESRTIEPRLPEQAWFWTSEWQAGEHEVDQELAHGEYADYETTEDVLAHLHVAV